MELRSLDLVRAAHASAAARGREHPGHARSGRRVRQAGHAVFDRQGQRGDAARRAEGVLPGAAAVSAAARRHALEIQGDVRAAQQDDAAARARADRVHEPGRRRAGHQPVHARLGDPHRRHEDAGAEAGARQVRLQRGLRRRAARRREEPRQGAHLFVPQRAAPLGPEEPAPRALVALQHAHAQGREPAGVPDVELDRARHLAVHLPERHPDRAALFRGRTSRRRARRHADHGRRRAHAACAPARSRC